MLANKRLRQAACNEDCAARCAAGREVDAPGGVNARLGSRKGVGAVVANARRAVSALPATRRAVGFYISRRAAHGGHAAGAAARCVDAVQDVRVEIDQPGVDVL